MNRLASLRTKIRYLRKSLIALFNVCTITLSQNAYETVKINVATPVLFNNKRPLNSFYNIKHK